MKPDSRPLELEPGLVLSATSLEGASVFFEVRRKIGQGGEGVVYEAQTDDGLYAIVKGPKLVGARDLDLEREARHLATVNPHPNVVRFLGTHKDPRGHSLLFLERCFENPLRILNQDEVRARLEAREQARGVQPPRGVLFGKARFFAPPISIALELGYELALGLEHLHAKGLVHGDVKPPNAMLAIDCREPDLSVREYCERLVKGRWRGVVIDLGGARTAKELDALARGLPVVKPPKITPAYVPPEVIPGLPDASGAERSRFTFAMDAYALGLTVYRILTGYLPYAHLASVPDMSVLANVVKVKRDERDGAHRPISRAALDTLDWSDCSVEGDRARLVEEIWDFLVKATHPDPAQRARVPELRQKLAHILAVQPASEDGETRDASSGDDPRTQRDWTQRRFRVDAFASRLADAARGSTKARDPKTLKIQRGGGDFWEMQGFAPR